MKLPYASKAVVRREKLRNYLLSEAHPIGRFKSVFFRGLGFVTEDLEPLENGLLALLANDVENEISTDYGVKYEVRGTLTGPGRSSAAVVSVWIILSGENYPRFVTAYPE